MRNEIPLTDDVFHTSSSNTDNGMFIHAFIIFVLYILTQLEIWNSYILSIFNGAVIGRIQTSKGVVISAICMVILYMCIMWLLEKNED